jgi:hypothetical protein
MPSECPFKQKYLEGVASTSIDAAVREALACIQTHLYPGAVLPPSAKFRSITALQAIIESKQSNRGVWDPAKIEMTLIEGLWCVKVVLHETLHSVSSFQSLKEALQLQPLFEGLTECLAGYLLYKGFQYSYSNCWKPDDPLIPCQLTYERNCRHWSAFFHFVPIKTIVPLYFERLPDWGTMCSRFVEYVRVSGYKTFQDVLGGVLTAARPTTELDFWIECKRSLGKKFKIMSGTRYAFDFSRVL